MTQANVPSSLQGCAIRVARLDSSGAPLAGPNNLYVSNQWLKLSWKAEYEAGQEFVLRNACGDLTTVYKDRDVAKRYSVVLDLTVPDPELEELLTGAPVITTPTVSTPAAPTASTATTGGTLAPATYSYAVTFFDGLGETVASPAATQIVPAGTNTNVVTVIFPALPAGATTGGYWRVYGRTGGGLGLLATVAATQPNFVDTGANTPGAASPVVASTPQTIGGQAPPLGVYPAHYNNGVSVEVWTKAILGGSQAPWLPWHWWVLPWTTWQIGERAAENADMKHPFNGMSIENPSWGRGPMNDWPAYATPVSRAWSHVRSASIPTPASGYQTALA